MSYQEAKNAYAAYGVDAETAIETLKTVPVSLHCWQGDDVRGFDTDPNAPLTGGIQTTGNYPGRARTPEELMADLDKVLTLIPGRPKMNLHASYAIFEDGEWADRDRLEPKHFQKCPDFTLYIKLRRVPLHVRQSHTGAETQRPRFRAGGGESLRHRLGDIRNARADIL